MAEVLLEVLVQESYRRTREFRTVSSIATNLVEHLRTPEAVERIAAVNQPRKSSALVQAAFAPFAEELGFKNESKGLFSSYERSALRPDFYMPLGETGIIMEVERGKTTINNMDLLDFWKCHLCESANYLFLLVPQALRQNDTQRPRNEFAAVVKRLGHFFTPRNYTNVRAAFIFGY